MPSMDLNDVIERVRNVGTTYNRASGYEHVNADDCVRIYEEFIEALAEGRFYGDVTAAARVIKKLF